MVLNIRAEFRDAKGCVHQTNVWSHDWLYRMTNENIISIGGVGYAYDPVGQSDESVLCRHSPAWLAGRGHTSTSSNPVGGGWARYARPGVAVTEHPWDVTQVGVVLQHQRGRRVPDRLRLRLRQATLRGHKTRQPNR
ncbi:MAG: hypothetical protein ABSE16_20530 [Verrucomicrobiota bacterium]|jgi:hypothetical protein